ncbi:spindle pole body component 110-like [Melanaphis sacchari]|uniref:spindle pole body component 110-like n=1 Tax=Melanaphis sacchari TaxID=742174 RepID=UPI000DC1342B|nr:spindle pole body component 110-like [Melanaphis sacchari]
MDENSSENILQTIQDIDKTILQISECIQILRNAENKLNLKENKTLDEITTFQNLQKTIGLQLKELDEKFELSNQLKMSVVDHTYKLMNINYGGTVDQLNPGYQDRIPIFAQNVNSYFYIIKYSHDYLYFNIMVLQLMVCIFEDPHTVCQNNCSIRECGYNGDSNCCSASSNALNKNTLMSQCSDSFYNSQEVCQLKEQLQNIINENQELLFKYKSITERNDLLVKVLNRPEIFKKIEGCIRFPGKKEMEEKLSEFKTEILRLNSEIKEIHITQLKLKSAKEIFNQFNATNCQCESFTCNENINASTKVQQQEIQQIELRIKEKTNELNNIVFHYENIGKTNDNIIDAHKKLADDLVELLKKIKENDLNGFKDLINNLNKNNEDIETMELIIKERGNEINDCKEKLRRVQLETNDITLKTKKLEDSMKNLSNDFNESYNKLELVYKEQLEEMLALPKVLKETHIKLQEETDLRVLAEETMYKLEYDIKQVESLKIQNENDDEKKNQTIKDEQLKIEAENKVIESKLKSLEQNVELAKECIDKETQELNAVNLQIQDAIAESSKHINAFKHFSEIHLERIVSDLSKLKEICTESQRRECTKFLAKKSFMDLLKDRITSINQNVETCKLEVRNILEQPN